MIQVPIWAVFWSNDYKISTAGYVWTALYAAWMGVSDISSTNLGRPWKWFENIPLFPWMFSYFPMTIQTTGKPLDPAGLYIFGTHPHGVLAFNRAMVGVAQSTSKSNVPNTQPLPTHTPAPGSLSLARSPARSLHLSLFTPFTLSPSPFTTRPSPASLAVRIQYQDT